MELTKEEKSALLVDIGIVLSELYQNTRYTSDLWLGINEASKKISALIDEIPEEEESAMVKARIEKPKEDKRCGTCKHWRKDDVVGCDLRRSFAVRRDYNDGTQCFDWKAKEPEQDQCKWCDKPIYKRDACNPTWYHDKEFHRQYCEGDYFSHIAEPKEKKRVWECGNCGKDIYYRGGYSHCDTDYFLCDITGILKGCAFPKPDSDRWVEHSSHSQEYLIGDSSEGK